MLRTHPPKLAPIAAWCRLLGLLFAGLTASCGGGGPSNTASAMPGSGGTGSYTVGTITGFGSIIVNGVRYSYDLTSTPIARLDDDTSSSEFKLGMVVEIEGDKPVAPSTGTSTTPTAKAQQIRVGSVLVGRVGSMNTTAGTFTVLGQSVLTSVDTFFDENNTTRLAGLGPKTSNCQYVKVYGFPPASQASNYTATRVECLSEKPANYQLVGTITETQTATASLPGSIKIGSRSYQLAGSVQPLPVGTIVRARIPSVGTNTTWAISDLTGNDRVPPSTGDARVEGKMTDYAASTGTFRINGVSVQLPSTDANLFKDGTTRADLRNDLSVSVRGTVVEGVLQANQLESEDAYQGSDDDGSTHTGTRDIELHGSGSDVSQVAGNTFVFRGVRVSFTESVLNSATAATALQNAREIEIHGKRATDGIGIIAITIDLGGN